MIMNIPPEILRIVRDLKIQDNRMTDNPVFCVQQLVRDYGVSEDYTDDYVFVDEDWNECEEDDIGATQVFYKDTWVTIQFFLTENGAKDYITINGHNISGPNGEPPRIYVESGWRNEEWRTVREFLMRLDISP